MPHAEVDLASTPSGAAAAQPAGGLEAAMLSLRAELEEALQWIADVRVQLRLYDGPSVLLREPRQRARLVRFLLERVRSFRESGLREQTLSWRDHPSLIALDSIHFERDAAGLSIAGGVASSADEAKEPAH